MSTSYVALRRVTRAAGLTLVELMIATVISLVLLAGVMTIFSSSKATSRLQTGLATVQENGRHALYTLVRDIRSAGFSGCAGLAPVTVNLIANNPPTGMTGFTGDDIVFGEDNVSAGNPMGAAPGTDIIRVRGAGDSLIGLVGNTVPVNANIQTTVAKGYFTAGDILVITDCEGVDIFRATTVSQSGNKSTISHSNSNNASNFLSKPYDKDAFVLKFKSNTYFVADTGRDNAVGHDIFALYGLDGTNPAAVAIELVDGVEDLQITYGVDGDGNRQVDRFVDASAVTDWETVREVKISLLVNSIDNVTGQTAPYSFLGAMNTPAIAGDFRLRQEMTTAVTVRNAVD